MPLIGPFDAGASQGPPQGGAYPILLKSLRRPSEPVVEVQENFVREGKILISVESVGRPDPKAQANDHTACVLDEALIKVHQAAEVDLPEWQRVIGELPHPML